MGKKLLLVEDDIVFSKLISKFLDKNGFEVSDAKNGKDALQILEADRFDLAILDYRLPDMNGLDVMNSLKEKSPQAKVVLMTRFGEEAAGKAIGAGADAFISKPINPEELLEVVTRLH
jgi:DNA-binding response OmpR family regulator